MKTYPLGKFNLSPDFSLKTVASLQEMGNHDLIYIYHHLQVDSDVILIADGTNIKGDIRYKVLFKEYLLGYVTLGGYFRPYYEEHSFLSARIKSMKKEKFMPVQAMDIEVDLIKLKNVS